MKSQSDSLFQIASDICEDIRMAYPELRGLDRDLARLSLLVESRGLGTFTLDLPSRESALIAGLETGLLCSKGTQVYSKRYPVPRLFAGLYMRIFDSQLRLRVDADVNAIAFLRQLLVLGKKIEVPCSRERELAAIEDYVHVEAQTIRPTLGWLSDSLCSGDDTLGIHLLDICGPELPMQFGNEFTGAQKLLLQRCQRVADFVAEMLGIYCPDCFIEENRTASLPLGLRHGPGAVAERGGRFYDKYRFTNWSAKLSSMFPFSSFGKMPNDDRASPLNHEVPARLICVPKTAKGPRIIAAEPSEHMFVQKLLSNWLEKRIAETELSHFINFRDQSLSGGMVVKASRDRSLATIDLSSASDRLSLYVVERMFRRNPSFLKALHASRTRWLRLPNGECIELKKFASQGTAVTFPVQTLVFFIIAMAVAMEGDVSLAKLRSLRNKVRIFGDDIIIPNTGFAGTADLLHMLRLKVNAEKSFSCGFFRESCGVDAFRGYDVTPIKPKTAVSEGPASRQALLDLSNNLFKKGYWNASTKLEHRQRSRSRQYYGIVGYDAGAPGYVSFSLGTVVGRIHRILHSLASGREFPLSQERIPEWRGSTYYQAFLALSRGEGLFSGDPRWRLRWNDVFHRVEVRQASIASKSAIEPYHEGYSGLLDAQLRPRDHSSPTGGGTRGVPERPRHREVTRWVAFTDLFSGGQRV